MSNDKVTEIPNQAKEDHTNGDLWDEDSNDYICTIPDEGRAIAVNLSLFHNGFWYVYRLERRYVEDAEAIEPPKPNADMIDLVKELNRKDVTQP